ncbi:MAG: hypothetical protein ABR583_00300 [Gaiellaceae bacterium]
MTQVVAIDWSGRDKGAAEAIWLAMVIEGELIDLDNGRTRQEVIDHAIALVKEDAHTVVGLDFAFGFPAWYAEREGWASGRAVWEAMRDRGEPLLGACEPPLWGRPGMRAQKLGDPYRHTEKALAISPRASSRSAGPEP